MHPATRLLPICTLALLPISLAAQDAPYRIYRDARVPLSIDNTRIAVRALSTTTTNRLVEAARSLGIPASSVDPAGAPTWFFLNLIDPLLATDDVRRAVARLSKHASIGFAAPALHGIDGHWATITPDILMQFRELPEDPLRVVRAKSRLESAGISPFGGLTRAFVVRHSSKDGFAVLDAANRLAEDPGVAWAEPDWQFSGQGTLTPNDPGWAHLWGMHNTGQFSGVAGMDMDADLAWDITAGDASVKVLVIDNGVDQTHPDINQVPGVDLTGQNGGGGPVNQCDKHGSPVAGCVSAIMNNKLGTVGTAPLCKSLSARAFISTTPCTGRWTSYASWTVNALEEGRSRGCRVTNNSNGYGFRSSAIEAKYSATRQQGIIHFASAGNDGSTSSTYPSTLSTVHAVAALTSRGVLASFSNRGNSIYISAPGQSVYSTDNTGSSGYSSGDYTFVNGTSFASPYTAGVAALLISRRPSMTVQHIELALRTTRDLGSPGWDNTYGWGFLNANSALRCTPYGTGHPGAGGKVPELFGQGLPRIGQGFTLRTQQGASNATGILALGGSPLSLPFLGGRLLVGPSYVMLTQSFSPSGESVLSFTFPNQASFIGARLYMQSGIHDSLASQGVSFSNGLEIFIGP